MKIIPVNFEYKVVLRHYKMIWENEGGFIAIL